MAKKIANYLLTIMLVLTMVTPISVKAASLTIIPETEEVEVGKKMTFTIRVSNAYGTLNADGQTINLDSKAIDEAIIERSYMSENEYAFTVSGELTDYATGEKESYEETVIIKVVPEGSLEDDNNNTNQDSPTNPDTNQNPTDDNDTNTDQEEPSGEVRLASLTIKDTDGDEINIEFSSETTEYEIELTSEDTQITIDAKAWDEKAKVEGTGLKTIRDGENKFEIKVIAEDGKTEQIYTIKVNVKVVPITYLTYKDQEYGLMEELMGVSAPEGFNKSTATINKENVTIFKNGSLVLVYGLDEDENGEFFIYKEDDGIVGKYDPLTIGKTTIYLVDIPYNSRSREGMTLETITISGKQLEAWTFDDSQLIDYALIYALDKKGNEDYFVYDGKIQQLLEYPDSAPISYDEFQEWLVQEEKEKPNYFLYGSIGVVAIIVIGVVFWIVKKGKEENEEEEVIVPQQKTQPKQIQQPKIVKKQENVEPKKKRQPIKQDDDQDDDWLSDDFYKTILGDED